jgi:hypothetical protein
MIKAKSLILTSGGSDGIRFEYEKRTCFFPQLLGAAVSKRRRRFPYFYFLRT